MMTAAQVVETSLKVPPNSPSQDYTHPDDHNLRTYISILLAIKVSPLYIKKKKKKKKKKKHLGIKTSKTLFEQSHSPVPVLAV